MENERIINKKIHELRFIALDLEATYSKPIGRHEIIEIGACGLEPGTLNIMSSYTTLVRPLYPIIPAIKQKTGLTDEIVSKARPISEIWDEFLNFLQDTILLVYKTIDIGILQRTLEAYRLPLINNSFLDIFRLVKCLYPNESSYSLEHFQKLLKISITSHRARADAYVSALLFKHLIDLLGKKYKVFEYKELLNFCYLNKFLNNTQGKLF